MRSALTERQWPSKLLVKNCPLEYVNYPESFEMDFKHFPANCKICKKQIEPYKEKFYGVFSDYTQLLDEEYSHETGYCKECAEIKAKETRIKLPWYDTAYVVKKYETIKNGFPCQVQIYSDGSIVEDDPFLIQENATKQKQ